VESSRRPTFLEFFAGGGMVRAGLGPGWTCLLANDVDLAKAAAYTANWGRDGMRTGDVANLTPADCPGRADLAWASFPCQDLSLAGLGRGLEGGRSGTFWAFHRLMAALRDEGRAPRLIALENVHGLLTSRGGADVAAIVAALAGLGYRAGALAIDAERFLPQSRPRLFIVGVADDVAIPEGLVADAPGLWTTPPALLAAQAKLPRDVAARWRWWRLAEPPSRNLGLGDVIEDAAGPRWHAQDETDYLLSLMSDANRAKVRRAQARGTRLVGAVYRRTRRDASGARVQRAEVRFDDVAGCLRTPAGGSSRQTLLIVEGECVRSRLLTPRESARLMGLPDDYVLPRGATNAYHLTGDGVAVPIVRWLARQLFEPIVRASVEETDAPRLAAE
jgi:DNA (cytosine-5)-methyltransferase 1